MRFRVDSPLQWTSRRLYCVRTRCGGGATEKTYRPYDPDQLLLLPPVLQDWLPADHVVFFLSDLIDQLDLTAITAPYEQEARGYPPYHPRMMVKLLLYAYTVGVPSSRRIAQRCQEDVAFRVLTANNTPGFRTISDFRKRHLAALEALFVKVLRCCQRASLVRLGIIALDALTDSVPWGASPAAPGLSAFTASHLSLVRGGECIAWMLPSRRASCRSAADRTFPFPALFWGKRPDWPFCLQSSGGFVI